MLTCAEFVQAELNCLCQVVRECFCIGGYVLKTEMLQNLDGFSFTYLPQERDFIKIAKLKPMSSETGVHPISL